MRGYRRKGGGRQAATAPVSHHKTALVSAGEAPGAQYAEYIIVHGHERGQISSGCTFEARIGVSVIVLVRKRLQKPKNLDFQTISMVVNTKSMSKSSDL